MSKVAACPICKKDTKLNGSNQYRPFCSKRCRLIDLGQWINESYAITDTKTTETDFDLNAKKKH